MGGGVVQVDKITTVVLIGKTGNGKSSTANSILRRKAFKSKASSSGVTTSCQLDRVLYEDGRLVNVIDTPGLFDFTGDTKDMAKEITKCLELAKDGVHAVLVVLSVKSRFSREEEASIKCLEEIFGKRIFDYMILVFTGGDQLEDDELTLSDYLDDSPEPLKELLCLCDVRMVLFNNKTKDETKNADQVNELFVLVDSVVEMNEGKPYTSSLLPDVEYDSIEGSSKLHIDEYEERKKMMYEEQLQHVVEEIDKRLNAQIELLREQLENERIARESVEKNFMEQLAEEEEKRKKAENDAEEIKINLEEAKKEFREKIENHKNKCIIL
ncbi:hypothetical protein J5N97_012724 [Dioscorea zingiberensis]|uniref:AIG1-type G domain-containing protein n=1 Tax=Dioscorea zingiberensis TaxID=325984 RepID=A0A9D5HI04_9LILI|nr:hypothetical protein J5N97_012724 [Dioscorea zingiberensis]